MRTWATKKREEGQAVKKKILALVLCAGLTLTGCASMLERDYLSVTTHPQLPAADDDSNAVWVENYQELVSAILYQVKQHQEEGTIRLRDYKGDVEASLTKACQEVSHDDPLGSYAIDRIKHSYERIVMYYEATITIDYRRTKEQLDAVATVTGNGAIRAELRDALAGFVPEVALRVNYFGDDADYIRSLIRQAYYDTPTAALGMPEVVVTLYPDTGLQRIVEVTFAYDDTPEVLRTRQEAMLTAARELAGPILVQGLAGEPLISALWTALRDQAYPETGAAQSGPGNTAYAALVEQNGDSEGMALAFQLLCQAAELDCSVVQGSRAGEVRFWNMVMTEEGYRHVDATEAEGLLLTDDAYRALTGAEWSAEEYPVCGDGGELAPEESDSPAAP